MTISITSKTLSDYDAHLAFNTATAFLRKSDLANYLIDQLEQQHVKINLEVSADPALADKDSSNDGSILWNLHTATSPSPQLSDVSALLSRIPAGQKQYITSQWVLMHLLALACHQLNDWCSATSSEACLPINKQTAKTAFHISTVTHSTRTSMTATGRVRL